MKSSLTKKILCGLMSCTIILSGAAVLADEETSSSPSPVLDLDIAGYQGFLKEGSVLQDKVSGKVMKTRDGINTPMTGINYGIYKEEQNGTPYLYVDGCVEMTGLSQSYADELTVEMWIAVDEHIPQNKAFIYNMKTDTNSVSRCFTTTSNEDHVLKFTGTSDNHGNDKFSYSQNPGWKHVVMTQYKENNSVFMNLYVDGKYIGRNSFAPDKFILDSTINTLTLGGQVNRTYNFTDANTLGGNSKFYLGEFKVYNTCLDNRAADATNILPLYEEDAAKYAFTPSKANVEEDGTVIDLDFSGDSIKNKVNANDTITPYAGTEITRGTINSLGSQTPYITVNAENKGYKIDSERFERLPEQTYEMWIRFKDASVYNSLFSVGNEDMSKRETFRVSGRSYNQIVTEINSAGGTQGFLDNNYANGSWFANGDNNDEWTHVVLSRYMVDEKTSSSTRGRFAGTVYINGKSIFDTVKTNNDTIDYTQSLINNLQNIVLGSHGGNDIANSDIAKFKVYDRFMGPDEVSEIYNAEKDQFTDNYSNDFDLLRVEPLDNNFDKEVWVKVNNQSQYIKAYADAKGGTLNLVFSTPIKRESVTDDSVMLTDQNGNAVSGGIKVLQVSDQGYCLAVEYGKLAVDASTNRAVYNIKINGLQNLNGIALYGNKEFTVQNNAAVFSDETMTGSEAKREYYTNYSVDDAILDVKPFDGNTVRVTTNYDITDFDASGVAISGMTVSDAQYQNRTITITTSEPLTANTEYTVTADGKEKTFTAEAKPDAVVVGNVLYTDSDGRAITDVSQVTGTTEVNAVVDVTLRDAAGVSAEDFSVLLAVYDDAGKLVNVDLKKCSSDIADSGVIRYCTNVDGLQEKVTYRVEASVLCSNQGASAYDTLRTFVWKISDNQLESLSPAK